MAPRETENNAYAKFGVTNKEHYGMLWYFLERSKVLTANMAALLRGGPRIGQVSKFYPSLVLVISNEILLQLIDRILM